MKLKAYIRKIIIPVLFSLTTTILHSQIGVLTTSPNSTLDVRGSLAINYRSFNSNTTLDASDYAVVYSGTSPATVNLPTAVGCTGRYYLIKNTGVLADLTILPSGSEKIDGAASWLLNESNQSILLVSNNANWHVAAQNLPSQANGTNWYLNGNNNAAAKTIGTISNYDLPFITNNTEKMRLSAAGNLGIGATSFDASNPEKLLVDGGSSGSFNVISGKGTINSYLQLNIQNRSSGNTASSDIVASADNGNETVNFIDMGINSSGYSNSAAPVLDGANNGYLYSPGNDFILGNGTAGKKLAFFTGGYDLNDEHITVTGTGNVGIDTTAPTEKLQVEGNMRLSGANQSLFFDASVDPYSGIKNIVRSPDVNELMVFSGNDPSGSFGPDRIRFASHEIHFATTALGSGISSGDPSSFFENTSNVPTRLFINSDGNVAIGAVNFNNSSPEQLLVDAGTTSSYNVISGKGSYNNYLQLNIQNNSSTGASSSDIVATADNGTETTKYVDLGINSGSYTGTGIIGGANNAYLYTTGNDFIIGNSTDSKTLIFYTTTSGNSNQRMIISNAGLIPATTVLTRWEIVHDAILLHGLLTALFRHRTQGPKRIYNPCRMV